MKDPTVSSHPLLSSVFKSRFLRPVREDRPTVTKDPPEISNRMMPPSRAAKVMSRTAEANPANPNPAYPPLVAATPPDGPFDLCQRICQHFFKGKIRLVIEGSC